MTIRIVSGARGTGRTTEMIRVAAESFAYIICPDYKQVAYVRDMAREMGVDIPFPLTWNQFVNGKYYGRGIRGFVIDNLDMCIQGMTSVPVLAASVGPVDHTEIPQEQ